MSDLPDYRRDHKLSVEAMEVIYNSIYSDVIESLNITSDVKAIIKRDKELSIKKQCIVSGTLINTGILNIIGD